MPSALSGTTSIMERPSLVICVHNAAVRFRRPSRRLLIASPLRSSAPILHGAVGRGWPAAGEQAVGGAPRLGEQRLGSGEGGVKV